MSEPIKLRRKIDVWAETHEIISQISQATDKSIIELYHAAAQLLQAQQNARKGQ